MKQIVSYELEKEQQLLQTKINTLEKEIMILKDNEYRERGKTVYLMTILSTAIFSLCHFVLGRGMIPFSFWKVAAFSIVIGIITENIMFTLSGSKEKLKAFSSAKTEKQKIEEQLTKEISLEKAKGKYLANDQVKERLDRLEHQESTSDNSIATLSHNVDEAEQKFDKALEQYAIATKYYQLITKQKDDFKKECIMNFLPLLFAVTIMAPCMEASSLFLLGGIGVSIILSPLKAKLERVTRTHQEKKAYQKITEHFEDPKVALGNEKEMVLEIYRFALQIGKTGNKEVAYQEAKANLFYQVEEKRTQKLFVPENKQKLFTPSYDNIDVVEQEEIKPVVKQLHR